MDGVAGVTGVADKIIRFLVTHAHCTECGARYRVEDVYVLQQAGQHVWDLAAVCHQCYTLSIVRAVVRPHGRPVAAGEVGTALPDDAAPPAWSELNADEARRFAVLAPIGAADVRAAGRFLSAFDGDFHGLFGGEADGP